MKNYQKKIFYCLLFISNNMLAQSWQVSIMPSCPKATSNNAVSANGNFIYTFGGIDSTKLYSGIHQQCFRFNSNTWQWQVLPDLPDTLGKIAAAANTIKDTVYIIGGYHVYANGNEASSNKVHRFNTATNTFMPDGAPIPIPIDDQVQAIWRDSLIYVVTGWSNNTTVSNVQVYNPTLNSWSVASNTPMLPNYRAFGASGAIVNDTIYYLGGAINSPNFPTAYYLRKGVINPTNPSQINWNYVNIPQGGGYRMGATVQGDYICWIGGSITTYNYNGIAYNGSGGVPNLKRAIWYNYKTGNIVIDTANFFNMDLRGVASNADNTKYIIGGMQANQAVSNSCVQLLPNNAALDIATIEQSIGLQLAPNPASEMLQIFCKKNMSNVIIYNASGQAVLNVPQRNMQHIFIGSLPKGNYFVKIDVEGFQVYKQFIKN